MSKKLIYLSWMPYTNYVEKTWFIDYVISKGVQVEYWDVSKLIRGELYESVDTRPNFVREFVDYNHLRSNLGTLNTDDTMLVSLISISRASLKIYRIICEYNLKVAFIEWGDMPIKVSIERSWSSIIKKLQDPVRIIKIFWGIILKWTFIKLGFIKPFDVLFAVGSKALGRKYFSNKVVRFNFTDFEKYKESLNKCTGLVNYRYAVFLDINLPYQSDLSLDGAPKINPKIYYQSVNQFFKRVEEAYNLKIVIASHHKSRNNNSRFDGRECFSGETAVLVKNSEFVISHHSTSISYAVLNYKSILFIYTDEMRQFYAECRFRWIHDIAEFLDQPVYDTDCVCKNFSIDVIRPSLELYNKYKYLFLTSEGNEEHISAEIFYSELFS